MNVYIPILGLSKSFDLEDIQLLEIINVGSPGKSVLPPLSNISQKIINLLGLIDSVFLIREKRELHSVLKFTDLNNPEIFQGQEDIESIGLGAIFKIYDRAVYSKYISEFDNVCVTGLLDKYPNKRDILSGDFINNGTGNVAGKLSAFVDFIKKRGLTGEKAAFIYSGQIEEAGLNSVLEEKGQTDIRIINTENFNSLIESVFGKKKRKTLFFKAAAAFLSLTAAAAILTAAIYLGNIKNSSLSSENILTPQTEIITEGEFLALYSYDRDNTLLTLPDRLGSLDISFAPVKIAKARYLNLSVIGPAEENSFFIQLTDSNNRQLTLENIGVKFPLTGDDFTTYSLCLYDLDAAPIKYASVIRISNPNSQVGIDNIFFSEAKPEGAELLLYYRNGAFAASENANLISSVVFKGGGGIDFSQDETLNMKASNGWLWAVIPDTDIGKKNTLYIRAKTSVNVLISLELKYVNDMTELPIIADKNNLDRMRIFIPDTGGRFKLFPFELIIRENMKDKTSAHIIALSGPSGDLEISEIYF